MFNPRPKIVSLPLGDGRRCLVVDDALLQPEKLVDFALEQRSGFARAGRNAYPGIELRMSDASSVQLDDFFRLHVRARLGARRTLRMFSRLAMVTVPPHALQPRQSICHRDRLDHGEGERACASVLYLFPDPALGGTAFFEPRRPKAEMDRLIIDSGVLNAAAFAEKYGIEPGYMTGSNAYFDNTLAVPARWNRMVFYDGSEFHSGDIAQPHRLSDDPASGRLTLNGFFTCSRTASV